jgi:hypothetical protein
MCEKLDKIKLFTEKDIRKAILKKADPCVKNKNAKHWMGYIEINGKCLAKVMIPNEHTRDMYKSKSKYIARDLKLNGEEFNEFIECSLKHDEYIAILKDRCL